MLISKSVVFNFFAQLIGFNDLFIYITSQTDFAYAG